MGNPMVKRLLNADYGVTVFDKNHEAMAELINLGAHSADSVADLAQQSDCVITMVQTPEQVKSVCLGPEGIFANLKSAALYIDSSTIDIETSRELHHVAETRGLRMLDAPVSGGVAAAMAGRLTFMVGGDADLFANAQSVLAAMGQHLVHVGGPGNGVAAKLCNNLILAISMIGVSEAFVLASQLGLAPEKLFEVCSHSSAACWSLTQYCPWPGILPNAPASHEYKPGFTAAMMLKDLHLCQAAAAEQTKTLALLDQATQLYEQMLAEGGAEMDFSGVIKLVKGL
jgi:3-hydroxyisobutyrate dehydrogenase